MKLRKRCKLLETDICVKGQWPSNGSNPLTTVVISHKGIAAEQQDMDGCCVTLSPNVVAGCAYAYHCSS